MILLNHNDFAPLIHVQLLEAPGDSCPTHHNDCQTHGATVEQHCLSYLNCHAERSPVMLAEPCHTERSPVMLSAAKHLAAHRERPFAALRVTTRLLVWWLSKSVVTHSIELDMLCY